MERREEWFSVTKQSPKIVVVTQMKLQNAVEDGTNARIVFGYREPGVKLPESFVEIKSTPEILIAVVVSPFIENLFKDRENRLVFKRKLREAQSRIAFPEGDDELSSFFYPYATSEIKTISTRSEFKINNKRHLVAIASDHLNAPQLNYVKSLLDDVFRETGINIQIEKIDRTDPNWAKDYKSNLKFD